MPTNQRRDFMAMALAVASAHLLTTRDVSAEPARRVIVQRDAPKVNLDGWQMTASEVTFAPGESSAVHHHPGFAIGYVLEGQYNFAVNGEPPTVHSAGEMFFESIDAPGDTHSTSGNASKTRPAKVFVIVFTKKGDPATVAGEAGRK